MSDRALVEILHGLLDEQVIVSTRESGTTQGTLLDLTDDKATITEHGSTGHATVPLGDITRVAKRAGVSEREVWPPFPTDETQLDRERNIYLIGFGSLVLLGLVFRAATWHVEVSPDTQMLLVFASLAAKATLAYLTIRLSHFLRDPLWASILLAVLSLFALIYIIPLVMLLVGVRNTRKKIHELKGGTATVLGV